MDWVVTQLKRRQVTTQPTRLTHAELQLYPDLGPAARRVEDGDPPARLGSAQAGNAPDGVPQVRGRGAGPDGAVRVDPGRVGAAGAARRDRRRRRGPRGVPGAVPGRVRRLLLPGDEVRSRNRRNTDRVREGGGPLMRPPEANRWRK